MRLAVVVGRYGAGVIGGAESQARGFAEEAARRGWEVEVWSTCARDHYTWGNVFPAGCERIGNLVVRRFPVRREKMAQYHELEQALATHRALPAAEQYRWLESGAHSGALYDHVARHASSFDALVVLPYASPMMQLAAWAAPEQAIMWPCLHDEPYAYLEPVR
ncbi:MAG: hypothetical protein ACRDIB_03750, partial [Ardenticatenaceae bacterium]